LLNLSDKKPGLRATTEEGRAQRTAEAMRAYTAGTAAIAAKTARLRALRLAKEAEAVPEGPINARARKMHRVIDGC
jgi:hypothetical protein